MELIIELILEGILYLIGDGVYDKEESKNYSPKAKLILMIICTIFYGIMAFIFLFLSHELEDSVIRMVVVACAIGFIILIAVGWRKTIKALKERH